MSTSRLLSHERPLAWIEGSISSTRRKSLQAYKGSNEILKRTLRYAPEVEPATGKEGLAELVAAFIVLTIILNFKYKHRTYPKNIIDQHEHLPTTRWLDFVVSGRPSNITEMPADSLTCERLPNLPSRYHKVRNPAAGWGVSHYLI